MPLVAFMVVLWRLVDPDWADERHFVALFDSLDYPLFEFGTGDVICAVS